MGAAELGRYRLKRVLGRGAMGEVWEAHDTELGRRVAVKIMHTTDDELTLARTRFGREARIAAVLRHPNIVVVHDAGEVAGTCFMVMELVEGKPLRSLIGLPNVALDDKLRWIREIGDALAAMHEAGIVHRDVKPDNIIVRSDNSACLVDFGIAKWSRAAEAPTLEPGAVETADDIVVGTPDYLPPETRYAAVFDEKSDQYAWAVTAYELLAGVHPADVNGRSLKERADVPQPIIETIERARSKLPSDRFGSVEEAVDALMEAPKPLGPSKAPPRLAAAVRARREPPSRLPFFAIGFLAVLAIGAIALVLFLLMQKKQKEPPRDSPSHAPPSLSPSTSASAPAVEPSALREPMTSPTPSSGYVHAAHGPAAALVSMPAWVSRSSVEEFARSHEVSWAPCFAATPKQCLGKTITVTCDAVQGGALMHCRAAFTPPEGSACEAVRECVVSRLRPHLVGSGYVEPPAPKIAIRVVVPTTSSTKQVHGVFTFQTDALDVAEKAAFIRANQGAFDACMARMPICATHVWLIDCYVQGDGSVSGCKANPLGDTMPVVDFDCHTVVGECMSGKTKGIGPSDAGQRTLVARITFSAEKPRKPD